MAGCWEAGRQECRSQGKEGRQGCRPHGRSASLFSACCPTGPRPVVGTCIRPGWLIFWGVMATKSGISMRGILVGGLGESMVMDTCVGAIGRPSVAQTAGSQTRAELGPRGLGDLRSGRRRGRRPAPNWGADGGGGDPRRTGARTAGSETRAELGAAIRRPSVARTAGSETRAEQPYGGRR